MGKETKRVDKAVAGIKEKRWLKWLALKRKDG